MDSLRGQRRVWCGHLLPTRVPCPPRPQTKPLADFGEPNIRKRPSECRGLTLEAPPFPRTLGSLLEG